MAGLACRDVSPAAWKILDWLVSDFTAIPDAWAADGMRALADGGGDIPIVSGESAAGGMGILLAAAQDDEMSGALGLDDRSCVVLFGGEGATDPGIYRDIVGATASDISSARIPIRRPVGLRADSRDNSPVHSRRSSAGAPGGVTDQNSELLAQSRSRLGLPPV